MNPPLALAAALHAFVALPERDFAATRGALQREPTPAEIVLLVEAVAVRAAVAPGAAPVLARDGEFRRRALRNPWCRVRAMRVLGLPVEAAPPEIGALLHTRPGDQCPICRPLAPEAGNGQ